MKILLVEDDEITTEALTKALSIHHYTVSAATDGETAWELVQTYEYDLVILDIVIPKIDGITLCRQLRSAGYKIPLLLLTARDSLSDRVIGLEAGADDYVIKPFDISELIARIRALLRRSPNTIDNFYTWENLKLNPDRCVVTYQDKPLHLTRKEYSLLELFLRNPHRIFSRSALLDRLWDAEEFPLEGAVTAHIKGLRQKLKSAGLKTDLLETVYGMGYRLKPAPESPKTSPDLNSTTTPANTDAKTKVMAALGQMWAKQKKDLPEKIKVFEKALAQISTGTLELSLQQQAKNEAHRLIGTLGTFGFLQGSQVVRQIEELFSTTVVEKKQATLLKKLLARLHQILDKDPIQTANFTKVDNPWHSLLVIDDDIDFAQGIQAEANAWELWVNVATNLTAARQSIANNPPDVILLDISFPDTAENGLNLLEEIKEKSPKIPVLVVTCHNQLSHRLQVARLGGDKFLQKPISTTEIFQSVKNSLHPPHPKDAKILIVDDDPHLLLHLRLLLQPWGLQIFTLEKPENFWQILESTAPDLLILDLDMPRYTGLDLCQIVRNDSRWSQLPVLFLSAHYQPDTLYQVFAAGADDYVRKPVVGPELISTILNRLERTQMRHKLQEIALPELPKNG